MKQRLTGVAMRKSCSPFRLRSKIFLVVSKVERMLTGRNRITKYL